MGAAGRDFHNFNVFYKDDESYEVVAFTATQIPNIVDRKYPKELAGKLYPQGIPIHDENELTHIIKRYAIDEVVFSYSDVSYENVMHKASIVQSSGANFVIMGAHKTMLKSKRPIIAICAVRTGCGKSATARRVSHLLKEMGQKVVVIRHPMPYGDLVKQRVQRFETYEDLVAHECTIEEIEEYEPHIEENTVVYAGVDYEAILREAEEEADIIIWDGGNNDLPFYQPDIFITLVDPHRPGHEMTFYPGESNLILADIIIISKEDTAHDSDIQIVKDNIKKMNPKASVIDATLHITVEESEKIKGRKVLAIEDGPTVTHGGMPYGAAVIAARRYGALTLVDPRPSAVGSIRDTFEKYPDIGTLLPAMGYGQEQILDLEKTINASDCEIVILGTPIDIRRRVKINKPIIRAKYEFQELGTPRLGKIIKGFAAQW
ncbi:MAG: GTPase [Candidatus Scalindua sp. AMX11]|nr:MAG: GTPase [Candidatus Scalindua sp.]NOG85385.1 GTPase [Planctomycetota bacterium]RZV84045.1 MAG: GTPase [Candidatus Scalindua sp. SCAELEC01]TDE65732.1 MAG: GTPase [Candidatus Scalindua sp. AMX11]GJQ59663.1 MAG: GTPase [Candidatus Scalindua sp.]